MCIAKPYQKPIRCSYWNINGHKSKIIGNKLSDPQFQDMILESDILGLAETHANEEISIPGFKLVKQKIREKKSKGPKIGGGLAVLVREQIEHLVQVIPNNNDDSIWVKLGNKLCGEDKDIFIGTYYVSPPSSSNKSQHMDFFTDINEEINFFNKKGVVLVQGDLNARTGRDKDFISYDKFDEELGVENFSNQHERNSQDHITNARGKELLDVCKLNDLLVMNGRKVGDLFGNCTSHQWNGSSVVDYFLAPNTFSKNILKFYVDKFIPWISDHCPIHTDIILSRGKTARKTADIELTNIPARFIWDEKAKKRYIEGLKTGAINDRLNSLLDSTDTNSLQIASEITDILTSNAQACKIKRYRPPKQLHGHSAPWFDQECSNAKKKLYKQGNILKQNPSDQNTRATIFQLKREIKKMVTRKKRAHEERMLNQMTEKKNENNHHDFWKILKKLSPKGNNDSLNVYPRSSPPLQISTSLKYPGRYTS